MSEQNFPARVLLGVTGGIAAYKAPVLVRALRAAGAEVEVVLTGAGRQFVTPMALQAVSGRPVREALFDPAAEAAMGHIELARWANCLLIAPATAHCIARLAHGLADDLLTTLCLASAAPLVLAPAMNRLMWQHPATQANLATLTARGARVLGPAEGEQACGEVGPGRMLQPEEIVGALHRRPGGELAGHRLLVTAGPTREAIDPVRYLSNRSSGKMGFAVAAAARAAGAEVCLVAGPVHQPTPPGVTRIDVESAEQMHRAVMAQVAACDIFIAAAAVADYRPEHQAAHKIKKSEAAFSLSLTRTRDILAEVAALAQPPFTVGFAAETEALARHAQGKRRDKRLDMIAANRVDSGLGFDADDNALTLYWEGGECELPRQPKRQLAAALIAQVAAHLPLPRAAAGSTPSGVVGEGG
ncbi:MAG: bifunctional phosphopantothenoylcysteine decarboxylase/phosphopantothenate--cysteine ligase CoaBC [Pseudomonadota bacterium]|nr:bifunctional phosphopantothenoylcysteine decarboxylase/phosphopantothenate--cysteine ligase CoaBC [Pseudomonadota bacterium]